MRFFIIAAFSLAGITSVSASICQNPGIWDEGDLGQTDAGKMPKTANITTGIGTLTRICGDLSDPSNGVDMYEILITGPTFTATTSGRGANPLLNPALYLFDVNGDGVIANNDSCVCTTQAQFLNVPITPGLYFLTIAVDDQEPENKNGKLIFGDITGTTGLILPQVKNTNLDSWTGNGSTTGQYLIDLTGAQFAESPEPATLGLIGAGLALIVARRRR
jgi:PEP-CTERM motif